MKRLTQQEFLEKAIQKHGDKYDYNKFEYITAKTKGIIICKIHGEFTQRANNHLNGDGCSKCANRYIPTTQEFIERCKIIHNNKYKYLEINYTNNHTRIKIECPIHGPFLQKPINHLQGSGCIECGGTKQSNTNEFVVKSLKIHSNLYGYGKVDYKNCETEVEIICKKHGSFFQSPRSHLSGSGCSHCKFEKLSNITISESQIEFLNFIEIKHRNINIGKFIVDGLDGQTIYEFLGDYWHANPSKFNLDKKHPHYKITFKKVYDKTFNRFKILKDSGYKIKYIWENDWKKFKQGKVDYLNILDF